MYHQYIVRFMLTGAFAHGTIYFFLLEITVWNKMRINNQENKKKNPSNTKLNRINQM